MRALARDHWVLWMVFPVPRGAQGRARRSSRSWVGAGWAAAAAKNIVSKVRSMGMDTGPLGVARVGATQGGFEGPYRSQEGTRNIPQDGIIGLYNAPPSLRMYMDLYNPDR